MHANKQRDGTYSIVPQMQGGLTTPAELKSLAEIAVKYEVPTVKVIQFSVFSVVQNCICYVFYSVCLEFCCFDDLVL
jgi:hypothetical protein